MTTIEDYELLREQHRRLRIAAQRVLDAADYPGDAPGQGARVDASQLRDLRRELERRAPAERHGLDEPASSVGGARLRSAHERYYHKKIN
jgi:hypothetical protein